MNDDIRRARQGGEQATWNHAIALCLLRAATNPMHKASMVLVIVDMIRAAEAKGHHIDILPVCETVSAMLALEEEQDSPDV